MPFGVLTYLLAYLGVWTRVGSRKHVLDMGAHWRHLENTTEPSMCGGDAAFRQNSLTSYYYSAASQYYVRKCFLLLPTE